MRERDQPTRGGAKKRGGVGGREGVSSTNKGKRDRPTRERDHPTREVVRAGEGTLPNREGGTETASKKGGETLQPKREEWGGDRKQEGK